MELSDQWYRLPRGRRARRRLDVVTIDGQHEYLTIDSQFVAAYDDRVTLMRRPPKRWRDRMQGEAAKAARRST